ncbi:hypothetical protein ABT352_05605 [Streptosporangium sp. NPDC000563]|uniref:hypothetical protein n=1 Tax=Streptosporangium sp. NPDC000563 TaxID=3154366 RepID=UPI00331951C6
MNLDERNIAEELRLLADQARPVHPRVQIDRAVTRSVRRRRVSWSVAGLAAACLVGTVIANPTLLAAGGRDVAAGVAELPDNTPQQARTVRDCMPKGGPVHEMDSNRRLPEQGDVDDFHLLAQYGDGEGSTALLGSTAGFVLCTPAKEGKEGDPAVFTYWGGKAPGDLTAGLTGDLTVDAYVVRTDGLPVREEQAKTGYFRVVAGRVAPEVRRVTIDWAPGQQADARVANGFFVGRIPAKHSPDPGGRVDAFGDPLRVADTPPVTVTAYDEAGAVAGRVRDVTYLWTGSEHGD